MWNWNGMVDVVVIRNLRVVDENWVVVDDGEVVVWGVLIWCWIRGCCEEI